MISGGERRERDALWQRIDQGGRLTPEESLRLRALASRDPDGAREWQLHESLPDLAPPPLDDLARARLVEQLVDRARQELRGGAPGGRGRRIALAGFAVAAGLAAVAGLQHARFGELAPRAHVQRGTDAQLVVNGQALLQRERELRNGDQVALVAGRGCVHLPGKVRACFSPGTRVIIEQATGPRRVLRLLRGRVVVELAKQPEGEQFSVVTAGLRATAIGTAFEVRQDDRGADALVLQGKVEISTDRDRLLVAAAEGVVLGNDGALVRQAGALPAQRAAWQVLQPVDAPIETPPAPAAPARIETALAPAAPEAVVPERRAAPGLGRVTVAPTTVTDLLVSARAAAARGDWHASAEYYQRVRQRYPRSREARTVLLSLAEIALSHHRQPARALHLFTNYVEAGGPLVQEARLGRVRALRELGAKAEERSATLDYLHHHPHSPAAAELRGRLGAAGIAP